MIDPLGLFHAEMGRKKEITTAQEAKVEFR